MHESKALKIARNSVNKIISDLSGRSGMGWDQIDIEIRDEIWQAWRDIIMKEIMESHDCCGIVDLCEECDGE